VAVHEAALACGKLTRVWNRRSAYPSEVIMSRQVELVVQPQPSESTMTRPLFRSMHTLIILATVLTTMGDAAAREVQLTACLFKVTFPGEPELQEQTAPTDDGFVRWYSALQKTATAFLRHECLCVRGMHQGKLSASYARERLTKFATATGLSKPVFTPIPFRHGLAMRMRGYKNIQGTPATYEAIAFLTNDCYADVVVGAASSQFQPPEMSVFSTSVTLIPSASPGPPAARWLEYQRTTTDAKRFLDVHYVSTVGPVVTYFQKFLTSRGGKVVLSRNQIRCDTGDGRTDEVLLFDSDGVLLSAVQYSPDQAPFAPVPNDPSMTVLRPVLCDAGTAADPRDIPARLSTILGR
jgi:hypothetical protein